MGREVKVYFLKNLILSNFIFIFIFILHTFLCNAQIERSYLLYVSFRTPFYRKLQFNHLQILNKSPYDGFAVQIISAYSDQKVNFEEFKNVISLIKKHTNKHIWPWIFLNRIIGYDRKHALNKNLNKFYFNNHRIDINHKYYIGVL